MDKKEIGLVAIAALVVIGLVGMKANIGDTGETAKTAVPTSTVAPPVSPQKTPEPEVKALETKKPVLPPAIRPLTPEETVEKFIWAVWEERYDEAISYLSPQNRFFKSKWDLLEYRRNLYRLTDGNLTKMRIVRTEYLDQPRTMVDIGFELYNEREKKWETFGLDLQKENSIWKVYS